MAINSTPLSTLLNRMKRFQQLSTAQEVDQVRDLDEALRTLRRDYNMPWTLKKTTIRVFKNVLEYPIAADHQDLAYIENSTANSNYDFTARFRFTSLQEFYENPDYRNDLAEIWDANTRYLGIRYSPLDSSESLVSSADNITGWTGSGDAGTPSIDRVFYKDSNSNASIKVPVTLNTGLAVISTVLTAKSDTDYRTKYFFIWVYLDSVPTDITLKYGDSAAAYCMTNVTSQFSGQPFKADDWNLLAMDLNTATQVGTVTGNFAYQSVTINGVTTGNYWIDSSYLRSWSLMDYWYYSGYNVASVSSQVADQSYFITTDPTYSTDSKLVGDEEWADVIMYDAMMTTLIDQKDSQMLERIQKKRDMAWDTLKDKYPDMAPIILTNRWNYTTDFTNSTLPIS